MILKEGKNMEIKRDDYLNKLIARQKNGLVKIITGLRRSGESYLLFNIFKKYFRICGRCRENR